MNACLSKSKYMLGLQCPKLLWYHFNEKDKIPPFDEATQATFDQGHEVGEWSKKRYPEGEEIIKYEKKNGQFIATVGGRGYFKVDEIIETMKESAWQLEHDYEHGFEPAKDDSLYFYYKYTFYCPKWSEKND